MSASASGWPDCSVRAMRSPSRYRRLASPSMFWTQRWSSADIWLPSRNWLSMRTTSPDLMTHVAAPVRSPAAASGYERELHDHAGHAFVERRLERAELALGWLRSAEPGFGEPGWSSPVGGESRRGLWRQPRRRIRESLELVEGCRRVLGGRGL